MAKTPKNKIVNQTASSLTISNYDSPFFSLAIAIINLISALVEYNNIDLNAFSVCNPNYLLLTISLCLTSVDTYMVYKGFQKNMLISCIKFFTTISIILSIFNISLSGSVFFEICELQDKYIILAKNFAKFQITKPFDSVYCVVIYLVSSAFQFIANILKIFANRQLKKQLYK